MREFSDEITNKNATNLKPTYKKINGIGPVTEYPELRYFLNMP
jgi:hypothetical protein